jgi:hypothetical protein
MILIVYEAAGGLAWHTKYQPGVKGIPGILIVPFPGYPAPPKTHEYADVVVEMLGLIYNAVDEYTHGFLIQ